MSSLEEYVEDLPRWKRIHHGKYRTELVTRVSQLMSEKDMSIFALAKECGWSQAFVSRLLSGNVKITMEVLAKLEVALDDDILVIPE